MVPKDDTRKAAVRCDNCGEISTAEIAPDGEITPLGQHEPCGCADAEIEVLEADDVLEHADS